MLPPSIQKQVEQAEAILSQVNAAQASEPAVAAPPVEAVPASQETVAVEPAAAPAQAPVAAKPADGEETWEKRYKTLQGFHNQNIQDLKRRLGEQQERSQSLAAKLAEMEAAKPEPVVDPKDAEVFGTDLVDMVKRVAETMFGSAAKQFDVRLAKLEQQLTGTSEVVAKTADEIFVDRLKALVPDFEEINVSEGFLAWLDEVDSVYGVPRQAALTAAGDARDVNRVAQVFLAYKRSLAPTHVEPQTPAPSKLDTQVSPRTSAAAAAPTQVRNTFTVAEVQAFYRDVQVGKYRGREAEADRLEAMYNDALAEGRLVDQATRRAG